NFGDFHRQKAVAFIFQARTQDTREGKIADFGEMQCLPPTFMPGA
ncbi:MAG: hypothetical protein ACI81P_002758, partial [Neolewinella sp.]